MSNTNNILQTQTLSSLHNAIMEADGKDHPPMLAPGNYVRWKSRIKRYIDTKPNHELIHYCLEHLPYKFKWAERTILVVEGSSETMTEGYMENYKNVPKDIRNLLQAEAEVVYIILIGIDNDIYCTVDACRKALDMWNVIERLKQCESINVQDPETNLYWEFGKFTSWDGESLKSYYSGFYKMMNELIRNYKANQDNTPRINRGTGYDNQRTFNDAGARQNVEEARIQLSAKQVDWRDDTDDEPDNQELEAHYMFMAKIQEHMAGNLKLRHLEVAFQKSTCNVRDLKGNDLLIASSSQAWLWHRCLSLLNFDSINLLSKNDIMIGLLNPMFDEYFNGTTSVVSKSSIVPTADASDKCQQQNTTPSTSTTVAEVITQLDIQTTPKPTT
ncbi:hypothetical protein Tco_1555461 [Tanacetum coccineum]